MNNLNRFPIPVVQITFGSILSSRRGEGDKVIHLSIYPLIQRIFLAKRDHFSDSQVSLMFPRWEKKQWNGSQLLRNKLNADQTPRWYSLRRSFSPHLWCSPLGRPAQQRERPQSVRNWRRTWRGTRRWECDRFSGADVSLASSWGGGNVKKKRKRKRKNDEIMHKEICVIESQKKRQHSTKISKWINKNIKFKPVSCRILGHFLFGSKSG